MILQLGGLAHVYFPFLTLYPRHAFEYLELSTVITESLIPSHLREWRRLKMSPSSTTQKIEQRIQIWKGLQFNNQLRGPKVPFAASNYFLSRQGFSGKMNENDLQNLDDYFFSIASWGSLKISVYSAFIFRKKAVLNFLDSTIVLSK